MIEGVASSVFLLGGFPDLCSLRWCFGLHFGAGEEVGMFQHCGDTGEESLTGSSPLKL